MKTIFQCIAGVGVWVVWFALVQLVFGSMIDDQVARVVAIFGLPAAALIERLLMAMQGSGSTRPRR